MYTTAADGTAADGTAANLIGVGRYSGTHSSHPTIYLHLNSKSKYSSKYSQKDRYISPELINLSERTANLQNHTVNTG